MELKDLIGNITSKDDLPIMMVKRMAAHIDILEETINIYREHLNEKEELLDVLKTKMAIEKRESSNQNIVYFGTIYPSDYGYDLIMDWAKTKKGEK